MSHKSNNNYMFFGNLEQMKRQIEIMMERMDHGSIDHLLCNGHDWADDHITVAKENMDQVFDFLMNEIGSKPANHMHLDHGHHKSGHSNMHNIQILDMDSEPSVRTFESFVNEKKKSKLKWHDSDAPDANGRFRDLGIRALAKWLIKTRKGDMRKITGSLNQQIAFNKNDDPKYAAKMEKVRAEVKRQLGKK